MSKLCLNCKQDIDTQFCPSCGQSATTHRYSLQHFFLHDFAHGVLHLDKGFFYTIKELFTRPGHSIREYIEGKRVQHINFITLLLLIIAAGHVVGNISTIRLIDTTHYLTTDQNILTKFDKITLEYPKLFTIVKLPFLALFTFVFFKKSKQNFTEALILNTYKVSAEISIAIIFTALAIICKGFIPTTCFFTIVSISTFGYSVWFYYQYFSVFGYSKSALFIRSVIATIILFMIIVTVTTFVIGFKDGFEGAR